MKKPVDNDVASARRPNEPHNLLLMSEDGQALIQKIKIDAGFRDEFDLKGALDAIWYGQLREVRGHRRLTQKQKIRSTTSLLTTVNKLRVELCGTNNKDGLSDEEMAHLVGFESCRVFEPAKLSKTADVQLGQNAQALSHVLSRIAKLAEELSWLADLCAQAQARQISDGRRPFSRRDELVCSLRLVYVCGLHPRKAPRISKNTSGVYRGKFLDFVQATLPVLGEKVPFESTLGPMIVKSLKALREPDFKRALSEKLGIENLTSC